MREFHVLNLGAGVQSTTIYLMWMDGDFDFPMDCAIFADTQDEPESVYRHLQWMQALGGPPIHRVTVGKLGDDLSKGMNSKGKRFASIPAFTSDQPGETQGMIRRQCTKEYKVDPIERYIRRELVGLKPKQRMPSDVHIFQYMGLSFDEPGRCARVKLRFNQIRWGSVRFPLFDEQMTRRDCVTYLEKRVPHEVPRSACVFCPFKSNREWRLLRDEDPEGWARAVEVDDAMRIPGNVVNRGLNQPLYVHRSCVPLKNANLHDDQRTLFDMECEGGCGL